MKVLQTGLRKYLIIQKYAIDLGELEFKFCTCKHLNHKIPLKVIIFDTVNSITILVHCRLWCEKQKNFYNEHVNILLMVFLVWLKSELNTLIVHVHYRFIQSAMA